MNKTTRFISIALLSFAQCAFAVSIVNITDFGAKPDGCDTTVAVKKALASIENNDEDTTLKNSKKTISILFSGKTAKLMEQGSTNDCIISNNKFNNTHLLKAHCCDGLILENNKIIKTTQYPPREAFEYKPFAIEYCDNLKIDAIKQ